MTISRAEACVEADRALNATGGLDHGWVTVDRRALEALVADARRVTELELTNGLLVASIKGYGAQLESIVQLSHQLLETAAPDGAKRDDREHYEKAMRAEWTPGGRG